MDRLDQLKSVESVQKLLSQQSYIAERALATTIFLALKLRRPLFLEGEAGVGKTEVANVLATGLGLPLFRLQCYEGLDLRSAAYEWNYPRQMLQIRMLQSADRLDPSSAMHDIFSRPFLLRRPLLQALEQSGGCVLLIDELDRADEEFEAFLLETLSEFQMTIPEIGTITAQTPPVVVLTSNRTREVHDALKRRCLYHWIEYPDAEKETSIVLSKVPEAPEQLSRQVVKYVQRLREEELYKRPGVAETLDWARALTVLDQTALHPEMVEATLGVLLKYQDDLEQVRAQNLAIPGR